ncbi:MAG: carboxypeptidase-like regulatory domain-containing protein [Ferruginibacter sp.]
MKLFITLLSLFIFTGAIAQKNISVKGTIRTDDGKGLNKASVLLYYPGQRDTLKTFTNDNGIYYFSNVQPRPVNITVSYIGYKKFSDNYNYTNTSGEEVNNDILMTPGDNLLETVTIESSRVQIKEDTVSYKIGTMFRKNDNVEEVLKKLRVRSRQRRKSNGTGKVRK